MLYNLECLCVGLSLSSERAATSPSESAVIVTSVVECMRYCILHNTEKEEEQKQIRTMLISQQVGSHSRTYFSHHHIYLSPYPILHCVVCLSAAPATIRKSS